jgi:heme exporter protein A
MTINVVNLGYEYDDEPVLESVNFNLNPGHILHIKGENGVGKSTLLKLLAGLYVPMSGEIMFKGVKIANALSCYQQEIIYLGHQLCLNMHLTALENFLFDLTCDGDEQKARASLECLGLTNHLDINCGKLSAGQRRRVQLARLSQTKACLWLLDEPFTALDRKGCEFLASMLLNHVKANGMIALTSHQSLPFGSTVIKELVLV